MRAIQQVPIPRIAPFGPDAAAVPPPTSGGMPVAGMSAIAATSFMLGMMALRLCWLPMVNCGLALAAVVLGLLGLRQIASARGRVAGRSEATAGLVLGLVVLGLSTAFVWALVVAWR